jgi:hypothetical protein
MAGGGHRLTLAGERYVDRVAEDIADVGDRRLEFGEGHCGKGTERETGDGRRRFVVSEPVQKGCQRHQAGAARSTAAHAPITPEAIAICIINASIAILKPFFNPIANNNRIKPNKNG